MVSRSTVALSFVVVVALLAGCSGILGDDGGPDSPEEFEYADGFSADGVTNVTQASESHRQAADRMDSYTYSFNVSLPQGDYSEYCTVADGNEKAYCKVEEPDREAEVYYEGDRQFIRSNTSDDGQVGTENRSFSTDSLLGWDVPTNLLRNSSEYETSVGELDGTPVVVYSLSGAENAADLYNITSLNVTDFTVEISVDSDGLIREVTYDVTYTTDDGEGRQFISVRLSDVNETSVQRPEWANES